MKFHIVGNGETVEDILRGYDLTIDELKSENKHIRIWNKLIPGTKLKIPVLSESIIEDINEIEPFIEDYYPKIKVEESPQIIEEFIEEQDDPQIIEDIIENSNIVEVNEYINKQDVINDSKSEEVLLENKETEEQINYNDNNAQFRYRYVYPHPYYYRPIIYVIPRR